MLFKNKILRSLGPLFLFLLFTTPGQAQTTFPITIDPDGYLGTFSLEGSAGRGGEKGVQVYDLLPGSYRFRIAYVTSHYFIVDSNGIVSHDPANDSRDSVIFDGTSTLKLKNLTIDFDPDQFPGPINIPWASNIWFDIPESLTLVPASEYRFWQAGSGNNAGRFFNVDASGQVGPSSIDDSSDVFIFNGTTLKMKNVTIRIDPQLYLGHYQMRLLKIAGTDSPISGINDVVLIPGLDYSMKLASLDAAAQVLFHVNGDGTLDLHSRANSNPVLDSSNSLEFDNTASPATLKLKNVTVNFEPGDFAGGYRLDLSQQTLGQYFSGPLTGHVLVPGLRYELRLGGNRIGYALDANGNFETWPSSGLIDLDGRFILDGNSIRFLNTGISVAPDDDSIWRLEFHVSSPINSGSSGPLQLTVVPGLSYRVTDFDASAPNNFWFDVLSPCAIDPEGGAEIGDTFYSITCVPVSNAGSDQTVDENTLITLDGTGSSFPAGSVEGYDWSQTAGPTVVLDDPTSATPTFTAPVVSAEDGSQTLTFGLIVSADETYSDEDTVDITVLHVNQAPVADAGDNSSVREGATAHLNGSFSFDPDGDDITYQWGQTGGNPVTLSGNTVSNPTFTAPLGGGTFIFQLQVSDGDLVSELSAGNDSAEDDTVQVTVGANNAPTAEAGSDQNVDEGSLVALNGTGSSDPDGDGLEHDWSQVSGPTVALDDASSATPTFNAPDVGAGGEDIVFQLIVTDDFEANPLDSGPDTVKVHVRNLNDPPNCDLAVASVDKLWPPNHKMKEVAVEGVSDPNGDPISITVGAVTQDEEVNDLGDGDSSPDATVKANLDGQDTVLIRSERSGKGNGRVYQVSFTAEDSGNETCNGSVSLTVPHSRKSTAVDDGQTVDSTLP